MPPSLHRIAALVCLGALSARADETFASRFSGEWKSLQREIRAIDEQLKLLPGIPADDLRDSRSFLRVFSPQQTNADRRIDFVIRILWREPEAVDLIALVPARKSHRTGLDFNYGFPEDFEVSLILPEKGAEQVAAFEAMSRHPALNGHPVVARPESGTKAIGVEVRVSRTCPAREGTPVMAFISLSEILCFSGDRNLAAGARVEIESPGVDQTPSYWTPGLLTDGATPLGFPERPLPSGEPEFIGWISAAKRSAEVPLSITLDLGATREIDGLCLFPALRPSIADFHGFGLPEHFLLTASGLPDGARTILLDRREVETPEIGHNPVGFRFPAAEARYVHLESTRLWKPYELYPAFLAFSEIQVLSRGETVSLGAGVTVPEAKKPVAAHASQFWSPSSLVDGMGPSGQLIPLRTWIEELDERLSLETLRHRLEARCATLETSWNRSGFAAIAAVGLSTLALALFFPFHYRSRERKRIREIRERIAGDLHDDVGSNLGSIQMLSAIARDRPDNHEELETIHRVAAETVSSVRDIVWLLHPGKNDRIATIDHLRETAAILLDPLEPLEWSLASDFGDWTLGDEDGRNLVLFFREVLHNIRRHSGASAVSIRLSQDGDQLVLAVSDNGCGIPAKILGRPTALRALHQRAVRLGGEVGIKSTAQAGTKVTLRFKPRSPGSVPEPTPHPNAL